MAPTTGQEASGSRSSRARRRTPSTAPPPACSDPAPITEEGGEATASRSMRLRRRTPASESPPPSQKTPPSQKAPPSHKASQKASQKGKRKVTRAPQGRKRARATGCEEDKNAEAAAAAADSASPPAAAEHASSGASSGVSSPLRRPSLTRTVIGVGAFGAQILEPFHKIDPTLIKAYGNLKKKYFAKQDRQCKLVTLDKHIPRSCMQNSKLIPVRESATKLILQIAKNVVGFSSHIDGKMLTRTSGFLIDWDADKKIAIVLTSAILIQSKPSSSDEWSATDDYSPHAEVCVHFMDKTDTTKVAELLHYDKHYNLALFKVAMDISTQIPSFASEVKFAEEVFVLGRDERRNLTIDHGYVEYKGPSGLLRHHHMFISCGINKLGIGGPIINCSGEFAGMSSLPEMGFIPSSVILKCLHMWKRFNCIPRLHVGMKFSAISLLDLPHIEKIACECDVDDGLIVTQVSEGSVAEKLGVRRGDIIKSWNGDSISTTIELENFLLDTCEKHLNEGNGIGSSVDLSIGIFHVRKGSHCRIKMSVNVSNDTEVIAIGTYPVTAAHFIMADDGGGMVQGRVSSREAHDDEEDYIENYPSHHDTRIPSDEVDDN